MNMNMLARPSAGILFVFAATLSGVVLATSTTATAQTSVGEITVTAPHVVREKDRRAANGMPLDVVSLTEHVGYGDLDLTTPAGVQTLKDRVAARAKNACDDLDRMYPADANPSPILDQSCLRSATESGMAQVDLILATVPGR
jgi:UrcA family protein